MQSDLDAILSADEEARASVAAAERAARARVDAARAEIAARVEQARREREDALTHEIAAILAEASRAADGIARRREEYNESRAGSADALLDRAADAYAEILRDGRRP